MSALSRGMPSISPARGNPPRRSVCFGFYPTVFTSFLIHDMEYGSVSLQCVKSVISNNLVISVGTRVRALQVAELYYGSISNTVIKRPRKKVTRIRVLEYNSYSSTVYLYYGIFIYSGLCSSAFTYYVLPYTYLGTRSTVPLYH
jgi:hypothetical protein